MKIHCLVQRLYRNYNYNTEIDVTLCSPDSPHLSPSPASYSLYINIFKVILFRITIVKMRLRIFMLRFLDSPHLSSPLYLVQRGEESAALF